MESRYLGVLRKLQETKSLDAEQQKAVQKMIEDALRGELKSNFKLSSDRYERPSRVRVRLNLHTKEGNIWSTAVFVMRQKKTKL